MTWVFLMTAIALAEPSGRLWREVTGGQTALSRTIDQHRDEVSGARRAGLRERREEVRRALEYANCAVTFHTAQTDLFAPPRSVAEDTSVAKFLSALLSEDLADRRRAYATLVTDPPRDGDALIQTYLAVYALIEAHVRSDFLRMFLRLQKRWPAVFVKRLRHLAARGDDGDRAYVVQLIRDAKKVTDPSVIRGLHLGPDAEADLDAILTSRGRRLFGEGFAGARD